MHNIREARSALKAIDPGCPYDDWFRIGTAAKAAGLSFKDFHEWSEPGYNYKDEKDCQTLWNSISANGRITPATLYHYAKDAGWQPLASFGENQGLPSIDLAQANHTISETEEAAENQNAVTIWERCIPAAIDESYISRKQGKPDGLKVYPENASNFFIKGKNVAGSLVVPCYNAGKLMTLQFILSDGEKLNLPGAKFGDGYFTVGEIKNHIYLCEGLGQAWAINAATSDAAIVCFGASRFKKVAQAIRRQYSVKNLIIVPDRGKENEAAKIAASVSGFWIELPADKNVNYDVNDYLQEHGLEELKNILEKLKKPKHNDYDDNSETKQNQASTLVAFALSKVILFHDKNSDVYSQNKQTNEIKKLESKAFRTWLSAEFYAASHTSVRDQSLREAISTLCGIARHEGECHDIYIRAAQHGDSYYIDLNENKLNRAICITLEGWKIVSNPPVKFIRPESMRSLPEPAVDGDFSKLWSLINIPEESRLLVITWLIECLRIDTPFPILELIGEQGSAKSTTQSFLRQLVDPNKCNLRGAPKTIDDIFVSAATNWLVSYENVSHLPAQVQDALCILSTGGGHAKRTLYSDIDETIIAVKRPIIINGISAAITAQDLIDRTISIETPTINNREEITNLSKLFEKNCSSIYGGLLTIFSKALAKLPNTQLPRSYSTRLIEFVRLGIAVAEVMGVLPDDFLRQFSDSREESIARTIDASPIASAVIDYFNGKENNKRMVSLPIKELFNRVNGTIVVRSSYDNWPRTPKGFADALRRAAPALRYYGINCYSEGKRGSYVYWRMEACGK